MLRDRERPHKDLIVSVCPTSTCEVVAVGSCGSRAKVGGASTCGALISRNPRRQEISGTRRLAKGWTNLSVRAYGKSSSTYKGDWRGLRSRAKARDGHISHVRNL